MALLVTWAEKDTRPQRDHTDAGGCVKGLFGRRG